MATKAQSFHEKERRLSTKLLNDMTFPQRPSGDI
jgi:hypothetical protein